jgi:hypothetical protein
MSGVKVGLWSPKESSLPQSGRPSSDIKDSFHSSLEKNRNEGTNIQNQFFSFYEILREEKKRKGEGRGKVEGRREKRKKEAL